MSSHLAIDVGTSAVKLYVGELAGDTLSFEAIDRFDNETKVVEGTHVWDIDYLVENIRESIENAVREYDTLASIGIDSTAGDFGLLSDGELLRDPYFYRDLSVWSTMSEITDQISEEDIFQLTGYNGAPGPYHYQYQSEPELFKRADAVVPLPQLVSHVLGGEICAEKSFAMTLRIFDIESATWARSLLERLELPADVLPEVRPAGDTVGVVDDLTLESHDTPPEIVLPPSHDTASAVGALPLTDDNRVFLCTGSWFIPGIELDEPVVTEEAYHTPASNEIGIEDTVRFLHNVPGFSLFEHCRSRWKEQGLLYEYAPLLERVSELGPADALIDIDDELFMEAQFEGGVENKIERYCHETAQPTPETEAEVTNCILTSLAAGAARILQGLMDITGEDPDRVHLGGGGVRNEVFCQMFASAIGLPVHAGPTEATAIGNVLAQLRAHEQIESFAEGRNVIERSSDITVYTPQDQARWTDIRGELDRLQR